MKFIGLEFENQLELKKWLGYTTIPTTIAWAMLLLLTQIEYHALFVIASMALLLLSGMNNYCEKNPDKFFFEPDLCWNMCQYYSYSNK